MRPQELLLDDFHGSSWFNVSRSSFPLFLLSRLHCVALLWCHDVNVAADIDIRPIRPNQTKPHPPVRFGYIRFAIRFYDSLGSYVLMGTKGRWIKISLDKLGDKLLALFIPLSFLFLIPGLLPQRRRVKLLTVCFPSVLLVSAPSGRFCAENWIHVRLNHAIKRERLNIQTVLNI